MDPESPLQIANFLLFSTTSLQWIILVLLLTASALISGAEVAFFSLTPTILEQAKREEQKNISRIEKMLQQPKRLLATILVANNFINIAIVLLFASLSSSFFLSSQKPYFQLFIEVVVITFIILLFGEILPKIYANKNNLRFAKFMSGTLYRLDRYFLFYLTSPMSQFTLFLEKNVGQKSNTFSVDQLSEALEITDQSDTTKEEDKILQGIVSFGNTDTKQVMCPRVDVFALSTSMRLEEILPQIIAKGFSRIPVYTERLDTIEGILYSKDLMPNLDQTDFEWISLLREPYFVPENKKLDDLLKEFQKKKIHIAIVVDEYGGTSGVVTLEDLIEEIVGDISDEFDDEEIEYSKIDAKNYVFEAKVSLKDFYRITDLEIEEEFEKAKGEAETLAGFILETAQSLPKLRQKVYFKSICFTIESVDKKRIKRVKVTLP